ncbi:MAG: hypothetical protein ACREPV_01220 [Lysobacter sp.]
MLGQSFRWIDYDDMSCLMYNERGVAVVRPGEVVIRWPRGSELRGKCGSVAQGKRYVERWMDARLRRGRSVG